MRSFWIFATEFGRTRYYDCLDRHDLSPAIAELKIMTQAVKSRRNWNLELRGNEEEI
jgi:hypothetical protein